VNKGHDHSTIVYDPHFPVAYSSSILGRVARVDRPQTSPGPSIRTLHRISGCSGRVEETLGNRLHYTLEATSLHGIIVLRKMTDMVPPLTLPLRKCYPMQLTQLLIHAILPASTVIEII